MSFPDGKPALTERASRRLGGMVQIASLAGVACCALGLVLAAITGQPLGRLAGAGLLILMATPILRMAGFAVAFALGGRGDWPYAVVSLVTIGLILAGAVLGR
jgi:hypothetical protein